MIAYLRQAAREPFAWGVSDCALFMADWVRVARGVDPAASLRGRYRCHLGAARHIRRRGGMEAMGRDLAAQAGLPETTAPGPGDIGLVRDPLAGPVFAIRTRIGWAAKGPGGLALGAFPVIVAWRI
ncbi:DUF6950 family protein [Methylobacterium persicinum]|uniref:DUF6950 domain-containing protein n=1 Tax=Methylobacterium persicinum TaxID=374426 RepID=A0ABU0HRY8_9HYPH|nr:hypothetical protein [Methylobacterium persicinum]MDQ0444672.1 hypothetical protein [Methylobacterium persicinum]GJE38550.1 hypothetical protein KHHGKMAE_2623 [Methylobacterium persicinum]